jgi:hypothetical protein
VLVLGVCAFAASARHKDWRTDTTSSFVSVAEPLRHERRQLNTRARRHRVLLLLWLWLLLLLLLLLFAAAVVLDFVARVVLFG